MRPAPGGILLLGFTLLACSRTRHDAVPRTERPGLTIRLDAPSGTPAGATVYVAGTFNRWNPGDPAYALERRGDGRYVITLPDSVRGPIEFKFTLGSWETVELKRSGAEVPNRGYTIAATGAAKHDAAVDRWRDGSPIAPLPSTAGRTVSILDSALRIPQLGRTRRVWIYLPPDYATSSKSYPVIYMHDGQNVFDQATSFAGEWGVDETLDSLHRRGDPGAIVVAIDHAGPRRFDEYSPWVNPRHGGGDGDEYVDFLVTTLKPHIDARYRTRADRLNTAVIGSSMGGLISLYAILRYPAVFGRAGVFSPALWVAPGIFPFARGAKPLRPDPRIYFVIGGREAVSAEEAARYVADQRRMVDTLVASGFQRGTEIHSKVSDEGKHAESFWRAEFAAAYRWLFR